jgi:hypothetical protein
MDDETQSQTTYEPQSMPDKKPMHEMRHNTQLLPKKKEKKRPFPSHKRGEDLYVLVAVFTTEPTHGVGVSATAAQAAIHPPRPVLHASKTGGAAGTATPNVNPAAA